MSAPRRCVPRVLRVPYVLAHIATVGPVKAFGYSDKPTAMPPWAQRLKRAHYNPVENIVPFAVAVSAGEIPDVHTGTTAICALVFVIARLAHPFTRVPAIRGTRMPAFAAGRPAPVVCLCEIIG